MYLAIRNVEPQDNYLLLLTFENGEERQFDMKPYLDIGIFKELKDPSLFKTVKTSFDSQTLRSHFVILNDRIHP
jgi:hypothetical protein